jgi:hypothetical protein
MDLGLDEDISLAVAPSTPGPGSIRELGPTRRARLWLGTVLAHLSCDRLNEVVIGRGCECDADHSLTKSSWDRENPINATAPCGPRLG